MPGWSRQDAGRSVVSRALPRWFRFVGRIEDIVSCNYVAGFRLSCCADWDQQIGVMELPRAFRTIVPTVPSDVPYLTVPAPR